MAYLVEFFEGQHTSPYWRGLFSELEEVAARVAGWIRFKQRQHHKMEVAAAAAAGRAEPRNAPPFGGLPSFQYSAVQGNSRGFDRAVQGLAT